MPSKLLRALQSIGGGGIAADPNSTWNTQEGPFGRMGTGTGGNVPDAMEIFRNEDDGFAARGTFAKFSDPAEFAEWKQAHMTGMPTQYGQQAQDRYNNRMFPQLTNSVKSPVFEALRNLKGLR